MIKITHTNNLWRCFHFFFSCIHNQNCIPIFVYDGNIILQISHFSYNLTFIIAQCHRAFLQSSQKGLGEGK